MLVSSAKQGYRSSYSLHSFWWWSRSAEWLGDIPILACCCLNLVSHPNKRTRIALLRGASMVLPFLLLVLCCFIKALSASCHTQSNALLKCIELLFLFDVLCIFHSIFTGWRTVLLCTVYSRNLLVLLQVVFFIWGFRQFRVLSSNILLVILWQRFIFLGIGSILDQGLPT